MVLNGFNSAAPQALYICVNYARPFSNALLFFLILHSCQRCLFNQQNRLCLPLNSLAHTDALVLFLLFHKIILLKQLLFICSNILIIRRNQVNFLIYGQDSKKNRVGRSVGKIKIILFDSQGRFFLKNNILHGKHIRKTRNL